MSFTVGGLTPQLTFAEFDSLKAQINGASA